MNRWPQVGRLSVGDVERLSLKEVLEESSPVYYRGEQVGEVRANSKFWPVSGFDVKGGIFSGLELQLRSLKALVSGGTANRIESQDQSRDQ
jgi:paraquat-inducible protein B